MLNFLAAAVVRIRVCMEIFFPKKEDDWPVFKQFIFSSMSANAPPHTKQLKLTNHSQCGLQMAPPQQQRWDLRDRYYGHNNDH